MALGTALASQVGSSEETYTNEVQTVTITGTPTGGTFTLTFNGATTAAIAYNATAAAVQTALEAILGVGNVTCGGGALPGSAVTVTFTGVLGGANQPAMTATGSFTGGASPAIAVTTTTPGVGYGDFVTPDRFWEFNAESLKADVQNIDSKALRSGNRVQRGDRRIKNTKGAGGDLDLEVMSKGFGRIFKHMLGKAPVITTPSGATNARLQTFTIGDPKGMSLTLQVGRPDVNGTVRPFTYKGCKLLSWELSNDVDGILMLKVSTDAQCEDLGQALAAASYAASAELLSYVGGSLQIGGLYTDVKSIKISGVVGYKTDRYFIRNSTLKKEPLPVKLYALSGEITAEFSDLQLYNLFVNKTPAALIANWDGPSIIDAGGSGYKAGLKATMPYVIFNGTTPNVTPDDLTTISLPFDILNDGTNEPLTLAYLTLDTAA